MLFWVLGFAGSIHEAGQSGDTRRCWSEKGVLGDVDEVKSPKEVSLFFGGGSRKKRRAAKRRLKVTHAVPFKHGVTPHFGKGPQFTHMLKKLPELPKIVSLIAHAQLGARE